MRFEGRAQFRRPGQVGLFARPGDDLAWQARLQVAAELAAGAEKCVFHGLAFLCKMPRRPCKLANLRPRKPAPMVQYRPLAVVCLLTCSTLVARAAEPFRYPTAAAATPS